MKHKNLKLKIIIITTIIIILSITIAILFFFTDIFRTKRGAFFRYFRTASNSLEILNDTDNESYKKAKQTTPYIVNGSMIVQSSSNIADSSIMDKLKCTVDGRINKQKEKAKYTIKINSSNTELFDLDLARDKDIYAFSSSLISNAYIGIKNENLQAIASAIIGDMYVPNEITELQFDKILDASKVEKNHIESYYDLLKNISQDSAFSKNSEKLQIEDKSYNVNTYTLKLEGKESAEVQSELLSKLTQDSIMMNYLTSKFRLLNLDEQYTDINTLNIKMREKIEELRINPESAENIEISVSEHRQKNMKTTIKINDRIFSLIHLNEDDKEIIIFELDDKKLTIGKEGDSKVLKYSYMEDDIEKSISIKSRQEGTVEENNCQNIIDITTVNGIKVVNYSYKGTTQFTNDIGVIDTFDPNSSAILNNYSKEQIEPFMKQLKNRINEVYISKGALIGINLDPIFKNIE